MSYEAFKAKVNALIEKSGEEIKVWFSRDKSRGKYCANCSDGTTIIGSESCLKVTVRWNGRNHQSMVVI